ncbi:phosphatase PAP2 family protein [Neptunitalea lumnitzerae]|uniref:Phosphatidic acid phosphatase type 2/haloperoxidase domain-containing protein n=1 Tax=Neptunitalea lumnitzerae TaxID=2965509 RepID=A0ABQ5MKY6_9FLAO|nr:phosphatase PAP2 family protein [Neptunitalea sp. Y10]GLB50071.1 hypothetical protein Y10_24390 [Neptunitalea sp. Y10]
MKVFVYKKMIPFYATLLFLAPFLVFPKGAVLLFINSLHTPFWDWFFANYTNLGDGAFIPLVLLILLFTSKFKYTYQFVISALLQIGVVLLLKEVFFTHLFRPYFYFNDAVKASINFVPGVKIRYTDTFPSGHTATIFFITTYFCLITKRKKGKFLPYVLCFLAVLVAISRVYLVQHFFIDVYFGMLFGIASAITARYIVKKYPKKWYTSKLAIVWPAQVSLSIRKVLTTLNLL